MGMNRIPELLAPAGSPESFWAGFEAGADAFYLGAPDFNARKRAKNFTLEEIEQTIAFAHQKGRKIYITLNTLVFDSEIPALLDLLVFLDRAGVDAVIIQDLGVLSLIKKHFPHLRIHASTQLFCHNSLQAQFLKDAGVSRIILPRELTIGEIVLISRKVPSEYEVFIHGSLCFAFSGCCLFSSYRFGASGNRGECKQVCRLPFLVKNERVFPFSMKDLYAAPVLEELLKINPASFKIEGRLKNAEYVSKTVGLYRKLLDAYAETGTVPQLRQQLKGQRAFSSGYLKGASYADLVDRKTQGTLGEKVGEGFVAENGKITIIPKITLAKGMRLRLMDSAGRVACEGTLLSFRTQSGKHGDKVTWNFKEAILSKQTYAVYLLGSFQPPDPRRMLRHALALHKSVKLKMSVRHTHGALMITASALPYLQNFAASFPLQLEPARNLEKPNALSAAVSKIFAEVDKYPFAIETLALALPSDAFCSLHALKQIRREVYKQIFEAYTGKRHAVEEQTRRAVLEDLQALQAGGGHGRMPDLDPASVYLTPLFIPEERLEKAIMHAKAQENNLVVASSYGLMPLLKGKRKFYTGPYIYCANSFAYAFLIENGAAVCVLPPDIGDVLLGKLSRYGSVVRLKRLVREMLATRLKMPQETYALWHSKFRVAAQGNYDVLYEEPV